MADPDLRARLDPLLAVLASRSQVRDVPSTTDGAAMKPEAYTAPSMLPDAARTKMPDGSWGIDLPAQVALLWSALGRFADLQIRTVTGSATFASLLTPLIWLPGQTYDVPITWSSTPAAAPKGAIARVDSSIVALGRIQYAVVEGSITTTGCVVRCSVGGVGQIPIGIGTPLTVTATGMYLSWPTFTGGS